VTASNFITYGSPITISVNQNSLEDGYFGTINYTITGTNVTSQTLGRATTGKVVFSGPGPETETVTWTIPDDSNISEFTFTLTTLDGTESTGPGETDPALYWSFSNNGLPTGFFVNVTNNGISNNEASHIHLVAGNPVTTDIYLGDDDQYVKIEKNGGDVVVGTNTNTNHWRFGTDGILTFPSGNMSIGNAFGGDGILGSTNTTVGVVAQGQYGGVGLQWIENISNIDSTSTQTLVAAVIVNSPLASTTGTVQVVTGFVSTGSVAEHTWEFGVDGDLTLPAGGDIKNSSGTSVLSNIQGEYIYEFDGTNTNLTITNVNFNLLFCKVANAYSGSATHTVNLPAGTLGQRLVVINVSTNCTLTISGFSEGIASVTNSSGPAEFIYTSNEGWFPMYGTYTGP
jgi:hypothetical protein